MKTFQSIGSYLLLGVAAIWSLVSVLGNRALVMGDELVFYTNVLVEEISSINQAGFLYDFVYSSAALCGDGYYACVKTINWVFLLGFAALLIAFAIYLGVPRLYATVFGAAILLSPIAVRTSFFMPDVMFYAFGGASIVVMFLWLQDRQRNTLLIAAGLAGAGMLIKPHGVFLVIGILLSVVVLRFFEAKQLLKPMVIYLAVAFGVRFVIGFIAAGPAGLGLFTGYAGDGAVSAVTGSIDQVSSNQDRLSVATEFGLLAFLAFIAGLILLSPGLFGALLQSDSGRFLEKNPTRSKSFLYFVLLVFLSQAAAFTFFVFYAASGGESFEQRVVFRYVEFIIPLIAIGIVANYLRSRARFQMTPISFVFLGLTAAAVIYSLNVFGEGINIRYADSGFTFLFSETNILLGAIVLLVVVSMMQFLGVETAIRRVTYASLLILFPALGIYTNLTLSQTTQQLAPLDEGADALQVAQENDPVENVYIVAPSKGEAQYLQMKSGVVDSTYLIASSPGVGAIPVDSEEAWILSIGPYEFFESSNGFRESGQNYSLERVTSKEIHYFGRQMIDSPIRSFSGFDNLNSRYSWFSNESPTVEFVDNLSNYRSVTLTFLVAETLTGGEIDAQVGETSYSLPLPSVSGKLSQVRIEFDGNQNSNDISFSGVERQITHGVGLYSIELNR